ncbi:MAG: hypothetical protein IT350_07230 [Deltaproteobacteria bacterium]|nr:hypothetical protein [Deltaproteobacteria bacterium]
MRLTTWPLLLAAMCVALVSGACDCEWPTLGDDDSDDDSDDDLSDDDGDDDADDDLGDDDADDDTAPDDDSDDDLDDDSVDDDTGDDDSIDDDTGLDCVWTIEEIAPAEATLWGSAIAVNALDQPMILANRIDTLGAYLATRGDDGGWTHELVDAEGYANTPAIALGADDEVHLAYWTGNPDPQYMTMRHTVGPPWVSDAVTISRLGRDDPSLAIGPDDAAHIGLGYCDYRGVGGYTESRTNRSGTWTLEWLLISNLMCPGVSVAVDANNDTWIATSMPVPIWYDGPLLVAHGRIPFLWPTETAAESVTPAKFSLALDPDGSPVVAFNQSSTSLYLGERRSAAWEITQLPAAGTVGNPRALAIDTQGHRHLIVHNKLAHLLMYGNDVSGQWAFTTLDTIPLDWAWASLALDSLGRPHVSYTLEYPTHVRYAGCRAD